MSSGALFVAGLMVTLIVGAALALLVWGAILDGRTQREFEDAQRGKDAPGNPAAPPAR